LSCVVLQSPEKFQRSLVELTAAVEGERTAVEEADRACSELAARQEMVGKVGVAGGSSRLAWRQLNSSRKVALMRPRA
jgi:hypothetical protein